MADNATTELKWEVVEHWLENWSDPENAKWSGEDCAFCREFYDDDELAVYEGYSCRGCPIHALTGLDGCSGTPWEDIQTAWYRLHHRVILKEEFREALEKEYRFLVHIALGELDEALAMCTLDFEDTLDEEEDFDEVDD